MSAFSVESNVDNILRECDAIISKYSDLELKYVTVTRTVFANDLQTLRDQVDTICEYVSLEINDSTITDEQNKIQLDNDGNNNVICNNDHQDDIVFVGSSNISTSIPIIDLCSPVRTTFKSRKRNAITPPDIGIIETVEKCDKSQPKVKCVICLDSALKKIPTTTTCGHIFCNKCIVLALKSSEKCPLCKTEKPKLIKLYGLNG